MPPFQGGYRPLNASAIVSFHHSFHGATRPGSAARRQTFALARVITLEDGKGGNHPGDSRRFFLPSLGESLRATHPQPGGSPWAPAGPSFCRSYSRRISFFTRWTAMY